MSNLGEVRDMTRRMLQDTDSSGYRWTEADLNAYAYEAGKRARDARPDMWISSSGETNTTELNSIGTAPDSALEAIAHYVAFLALSEDDADRGNTQTAADHLAMFNRILRGV